MRNRLTLTNPNIGDDDQPKRPAAASDDTLNLFDLGSLLLARRRMIAIVLGTVMVLATVILVLTPNTYESTATILPSGGVDKMAGLKSLAGMGGLISSDENSSELFPAILRSQLIGDALLARTFNFSDDEMVHTTTLPEYFEQDDHDKLLIALGSISVIDVNLKNGVITVGVDTEYPELSQAITAAYLEELESYNLHKRRSQAGERAVYLKRELTKVERELAQSEDSLEQFQSRNRDWAGSRNPQIVKALGRLGRDIEVSFQAFRYLRQEYEIARLDAQKDIPIVRLLDQPSLPTLKAGPKRLLTLVLVGVIALVLVVSWILLAEYLKRRSTGTENEAYVAFQSRVTEAFPVINRLKSKTRDPAEV